MVDQPLLVYPDPPPPLLAQTLDLAAEKAIVHLVHRQRQPARLQRLVRAPHPLGR